MPAAQDRARAGGLTALALLLATAVAPAEPEALGVRVVSLDVANGGQGSRVGMVIDAVPRTFVANPRGPLWGFLAKGATRRTLLQDLEGVQRAARARP